MSTSGGGSTSTQVRNRALSTSMTVIPGAAACTASIMCWMIVVAGITGLKSAT